MQYEYLNELNDKQRAAVEHIDGPLMIVAGAGSGKTKVLTTRIAHLMRKGVDPFNILALTFTNKAAAEMKERIEKILGNAEARNLYIGTFHSVFARILRAEAPRLGYPSNFTIYDTEDAKNLIKAIVKSFDLDDKLYKEHFVYAGISSAQHSLEDTADDANDAALPRHDEQYERRMIGKIYARYAARCFKNGAMDFDDLLFKLFELVTRFPE